MNKLKYLIVISTMAVFLPSCNDWLTVQPKDKIEKVKLFGTEEGFWQAYNGLYDKERFVLGYTLHARLPWMMTSDLMAGVCMHYGELSVTGKLQSHLYKDADVDAVFEKHFLGLYNIIAHANTILAYVDNVDFLSSQAYSLIKGEALAVRAFIHFELIRMWGPMPNSVEDGYTYLPYVREVSKDAHDYNTYEDYMELLIADLIEAESLLREHDPILKYSNAELNTTALVGDYERLEYNYRQHRINYYGVCALRARIALWMNDIQTATTYARTVIDATNEDGSKKFTLGVADDVVQSGKEDNNTNFLPTEHICGTYWDSYSWESFFQSEIENDRKTRLLANNLSAIYPYDLDDWRRTKWYYEWNIYAVPVKFRSKHNFSFPFIRLSEMYLILAECLPLNEANTVYEEFCTLKGVPYTPLIETERQNQILMEYYREFIAEGQLFFQNKRLGIRKVLWLNEDMAEGQYVVGLPERETDF